ncbi:MAG: hypothetical protein WAV50_02630 [Minisyncoccia bacterium]
MYLLWKWNAIVFLVQFVAGTVAYASSGNLWVAAGAIVVFPMLVALGMPDHNRTGVLYNLCLIAMTVATIVAITAYVFEHSFVGGVVLTMMGILAVVSLAVTTIQEFQGAGSKDPILMLFIIALPLGVGAVLGGVILLWRKYRDHTVPIM